MKFNKNFYATIFILFLFLFIPLRAFADKNPFGIDIPLESDAIYLVNQDTNTLVLEKNKDLKIPCSALAKIMTTILILESDAFKKNPKAFLSKEITATSEIFDRLYLKGASNADIKKGETITVKDALYATMLQSACEATMMLVNLISKDVASFVDCMNKKAKELNLKNTYFTDPDGLDTYEQYSTAYDMYVLTSYCLKNKFFKKIATTKTYEIPPTNMRNKPIKIIHTNKMLNKFAGGKSYDSRVQGIKTAKIEDKDSLVSIANFKNYNYLLVVLGAPKIKKETTIFKETKNIYDWVFKNLKLEIVATPGEKTIPTNIKVDFCKNGQELSLTPQKQVVLLLPSNVDKSTIFWDASTISSKKIKAPLKKGTFVGNIALKLSDQTIANVAVVASKNFDLDLPNLITFIIFKKILQPMNILLFVLTSILIFVIIFNKKNNKKKKSEHIKKYKPFK